MHWPSGSSDNTHPLHCNGDVLVNRNKFVGGLPDNIGASKVAFGKNEFHIRPPQLPFKS